MAQTPQRNPTDDDAQFDLLELLDEETFAKLEQSAERKGRSLQEQATYLVKVMLGLQQADPEDVELNLISQLYRRDRVTPLWG